MLTSSRTFFPKRGAREWTPRGRARPRSASKGVHLHGRILHCPPGSPEPRRRDSLGVGDGGLEPGPCPITQAGWPWASPTSPPLDSGGHTVPTSVTCRRVQGDASGHHHHHHHHLHQHHDLHDPIAITFSPWQGTRARPLPGGSAYPAGPSGLPGPSACLFTWTLTTC